MGKNSIDYLHLAYKVHNEPIIINWAYISSSAAMLLFLILQLGKHGFCVFVRPTSPSRPVVQLPPNLAKILAMVLAFDQSTNETLQ